MRFESRIALRYVLATRKHKHTLWMSILSILGLAVGVAALLISIALLSGLQGQIKQRLIASSPQILIEPAGGNTIADSASIIRRARALGMHEVRAYVSGVGYAANDAARRGRPARIRSQDSGKDDEIAVTREIAAATGLDLGRDITIIAPRTRLTPFGPMPVMRKYRIARLLPVSEEHPVDAWLSTEAAHELFGTGGEPTSIEMYGVPDSAEHVQGALAAEFPNVQVKTWKEINKPLYLALRLEKIVMFATIALVIVVAALNLISSMSMLITEKRPAVGVLRTLGATETNIHLLFLQVGLLIGVTGTVLGNVIGVGFAWMADTFHLIQLRGNVYFVDYLPFKLDLEDVLIVNAIAILLSVIGTWYPARVASRLDPITAIRTE
ncbi:MAG TPA: FtsX-like permease family protein [Thermoanaerobaculia bacterium]